MTTVERPPEGFSVEATFIAEQAVLSLRGELSISSAVKLGAFFAATIASGYRSVVLDLADLDLTDSVGLHVLADAASRLLASGGELTVRSPATVAPRRFDVTWLAGLVHPDPSDTPLGPEQSIATPGTPVRSIRSHPVDGLERILLLPADDHIVDAILRLVVNLATVTMAAADGVSVSLRRHGTLATVAASDRTVSVMDSDQYATGEGPCVDASVSGRWFHIESLDRESRWPAFTPKAKKLGIKAILSTPLLARSRPVGALNIYSRTESAFTTEDQELASVFATEASGLLSDARADISDPELEGRYREAMAGREVIAMAKGVIMERDGVSETDAFDALRRLSQMSSGRLRERAEEVVASTHAARSSGPGQQIDAGIGSVAEGRPALHVLPHLWPIGSDRGEDDA